MKKKLLLMLFALCSLAVQAEKVELSTPGTTFVVDLRKGSEPLFMYFGKKLAESDVKALPWATDATWGRMQLYPAYGVTHIGSEVALAMRHADGNMSSELLCEEYSIKDISDKAPNGEPRTGKLLTITLKDRNYPNIVKLYYLAYSDVDMIECWTDITNNEKKTVTLTQFYSSCLPVRRGNVYISHFHGSWGDEARLVEEKLNLGMLEIRNKEGVRNTHTDHPEVMFSLEGKPQLNHGDVIGAALMYSGNYSLKINTDQTGFHVFKAGINPENSEYHLKKGQTFTTPRVAYTFSSEGTSGASRNFHDWARSYQLRHGNQERMILLNSWEGVYLRIKQEEMNQMMADIAGMGGELFVMDDGWFGSKYPRTDDDAALGDWVVDKEKLPQGVEGLIEEAKKNNIKFGIWIEPEMTNTKSVLYEEHPDWVLKVDGRELRYGRGDTQLVLDMANPEVQDFVFSVVDSIMTKYPEVAYIKWDANAAVMGHGSQYLPKEDQSHMYIAFHEGLINVCQRIRAKYPDVIIQSCGSGGGRVNYGFLPYFDEFWVSDNTDALQRVYMQWGTSYFFPSIAMAQHISASPNHQINRTVSLKFRCDVAMSGRLGMEIQPKNMSDDEKELCRKAIADYKTVRKTIQFGDLYRLHSPYEGDNVASLMYVSKDKNEAVYFWYKLQTMHNEIFPRIKMHGLDPHKKYKVQELNRIDKNTIPCEGRVFTGAYLMANGIDTPYKHNASGKLRNEWSSRVIKLSVVE